MALSQHAGEPGRGKHQCDEQPDYPETPLATQPSTFWSSEPAAWLGYAQRTKTP